MQPSKEKPQVVVYVVVGNDYPDSVWATRDAALRYIQELKSTNRMPSSVGPNRPIYWREYEFVVREGWHSEQSYAAN
jgi:hypothetical protein